MNKQERKPLQWRDGERFQEGQVVGIVQFAILDNGQRRYSYRIGKESRKDPNRPFPFMDPRDISACREILNAIEVWVDCDRAEQHGNEAGRNGHRQNPMH